MHGDGRSGRYPQPEASRGSQHWLQLAVEHAPEVLAVPLADALGGGPGEIEWRSPLRRDGFAEYRDRAFLDRLGATLPHRSLESFWPRGGPQWDALATTSSGGLILVEAKAHLRELGSRCRASPASRARIRAALEETAAATATGWSDAWLDGCYQYANRLAHLYLLRVLNGLPAWLALVCFVGDDAMGGPQTAAEWAGALGEARRSLRLVPGTLDPFVIDVFPDVREIGRGEG